MVERGKVMKKKREIVFELLQGKGDGLVFEASCYKEGKRN